MWVVSIYMYITLSCIRRSTALNIPVYEYGMSFHLLVSSFFQQCPMVFSARIFHFLRSLLCCLVWVIWVRDRKMGSWRERMSSLPSVPALWLLVVQVCRAMPFTSAYKWASNWEFSLNLSVHLTIEISTSTLPMPGLFPRAPGIPTYEQAYQTIKSSAIKKNHNSSSVPFPYLWSS